MQKTYNIDNSRIYLIGGSGGGFMSLLTSSRSRDIWAAVSSWCPISDIVKWHEYYSPKPGSAKGYGVHIEKNIGCPQSDENARKEALRRSPVTYLEGVSYPLDISHGVADNVVPVEHAIWAFNNVLLKLKLPQLKRLPKPKRLRKVSRKLLKNSAEAKSMSAGFPAMSASIFFRAVIRTWAGSELNGC